MKASSSAFRGRVAIVIPALNEEAGLRRVLPDILQLVRENEWELVIVDDGSTDQTAGVAEQLGARVVRHVVSRGYGAALKTGIKATVRGFVATMDGDGQHDAEALINVVQRADQADMVIGARAGLRSSPLWRRPGKWVILQLARYIAQRELPDLNSGLRVIQRDVLLRYIHLCPDGFSFTTTLTLALLDRGCSVEYVPIRVAPALSPSTVRVTTGFETLLLILRLATLFKPLRLFVTVSLVLMAAGTVWAIPYAVSGRGVSIGAALLILSGVQLLFAGLLADQIATLRKERFE